MTKLFLVQLGGKKTLGFRSGCQEGGKGEGHNHCGNHARPDDQSLKILENAPKNHTSNYIYIFCFSQASQM